MSDLLDARRSLAHAANDLAAAIVRSERMQTTIGGSATSPTSGGDPSPQPVRDLALSGGVSPDRDLTAARSRAAKLVREAVQEIRDVLDPTVPSEPCICCGTRPACTDWRRREGERVGRCGRCSQQWERTGDCGREAHERWRQLGESTTVPREALCACPADDCTRDHPPGGCDNGRQHGKVCDACNKSAWRARRDAA